MKKFLRVLCLAIAAWVVSGTPAQASLITEIEGNDTFLTAQNLNGFFSLDFDPNIGTGAGGGFVNTSTTLPHVTVTAGASTFGNPDFFLFTLAAPSVIILDIDSVPLGTNFDTILTLYNALQVTSATSDDNGSDPGDGGGLIGGAFNSRIQTGVLPAGDYVVGVSQFAGTGLNVPAGGTYTLHVSADSATVPEPASLVLLGSGLAGLALRRRSRRG